MMPLARLPLVLAPFACAALLAAAPPDSLEGWIPGDMAGYLKVSSLGARLDEFLGSDARKELESMDAVKLIQSQEPWQKLLSVLEDFKRDTGRDGIGVFKDLFGQETVIAARNDPGSWGPDIVLVTRAPGEKELDAAIGALRKAVGAKIGYSPEGYKTPHGDRSIETIGEMSFATAGPVLAISNRIAVVQKVLDLGAGKAKDSVKESADFAKAASMVGGNDLATLVARTALIPNFNIPRKLDNPVASLLAGGIMAALGRSELVGLGLEAGAGGIRLRISSAVPAGAAGEGFSSFFPSASPDPLVGSLEKKGVLAVGELHRDLSSWWTSREALMLPQATEALAQFQGLMTLVMGGKDFQGQVLPDLGPGITLVAANQSYPGLAAKPQPSIPAFGIVFELKDAKGYGASLASAFGTILGMVNADRANKGEPIPFTLKTEKAGDVELQVAAPNRQKDARPVLMDNFSPSLAVAGSRVVIASSAELARTVVDALAGGKAGTAAAPAATAPDTLRIDSEAVGAALKDNFDFIVSDNMSKKLQSREQAEGEIKIIIEALKQLRDLSVESVKDGDVVRTTFTLRHRLGGTRSAANF